MKNTLRQQIIQHRKSLSVALIDDLNQQFLEQFISFFDTYQKIYNPKIIGGYVSIHNEINVLPALDYCRQLGVQTALPFCHGKNTALTFHAFNGNLSLLSPDIFKIPSPNPSSEIVIPNLIICPSVGICEKTNQRLGYGGGFFDKYAADNPDIHFISGFCDYQIVDNPVIFETHDLHFFTFFKLKINI